MHRVLAKVVAFVCFCWVVSPGQVCAATVGTVVPVVGTLSDLIYDDQRDLVYLANFSQNRVEIYSIGGRRLIGTIPTGNLPSSLALSPDRQTLYVANYQDYTMTVINLATNAVAGTISLLAQPGAIAVGSDGLVVILGSAGLMRLDPATQQLTRLAISPPAVPPAGLSSTTTAPLPQGFRAGLMASADGTTIIGLSANTLFVYEVASGQTLRSRSVSGLSAILSVAPDGRRFMAGPFLFDTSTLTILGRTGFAASNLSGGSVFSVDGNTVYATFSNQVAINALNTNQITPTSGRLPGVTPTLGVLQVLRASSLTPQLGLRLPEAVTSKIINSTDGQYLFALCTSGLLVIPIGQLNRLPILAVDTANVVLSVDACTKTIATTSVQVRNAGGGRLSFAATTNAAMAGNTTAPVILNLTSGLAPSSVQITFDPRRVTTYGNQQYAVILNSPEAVNIEPPILVNLVYRSTEQRGVIFPIAGLASSILLDQPRQRVYTTNFMLDQIDVFSIRDQRFLPPIRVGNQPLSMAFADPSTLVVANSGAENISVINLDTLQEADQIPMAPAPLNATPLVPHSIAASSNAVLFTVVVAPTSSGASFTSNGGSVWQLSLATRTAFPRLNLGGTTANSLNSRNYLTAPANGSAIVLVDNNSNGTLRLYDPVADSFVKSSSNAVPGMRGTASSAPDGSFFLFDNMLYNPSLTALGSMVPSGTASAATLAFGVVAGATDAFRVQAADAQVSVQRLQRINVSSLQSQQEFRLPEPVMDITPGSTGTGAAPRLWPPAATALLLGPRGTTQLWPQGTVTDGNFAYLLSVSGLTMMSLAPASGQGPSFTAQGVVNGATFRSPVALGSIISIFGTGLADQGVAGQVPLPTTLGGVCVMVNEVAVPLFYTSATQINAQLPPELAVGRTVFSIQSLGTGRSSGGVAVTTAAAAPGIFSVDVGGRTQAALFHAGDFSPVTPANPGLRDQDLILFVTGLGAVTPRVAAGSAASSNPLSVTSQQVLVTIGGRPMTVTYSGLSPGFVGLYQINLRVPADRVSGDSLPVVVSAGTASSPTSGAPVAAIR
ncbi:MAG: hypothetical protein NTZ98_01440 [Acidobacteria bacterium]|nr:hypothetical protein [Acidobacteriota bacterium]